MKSFKQSGQLTMHVMKQNGETRFHIYYYRINNTHVYKMYTISVIG